MRRPGGVHAAALALVLLAGLAAAPARAEIVELTILHTNDFHGRTDRAERVIATIRALRASHPISLLLDAGDTFESKIPGAVANGGREVVDFMNRAGYDGYAPGDNEFVEFRLEDVLANVRRIEQIWTDCRTRFGAGGPFLFGAFGAADAMFAPVVSRFHTYAVEVGPASGDYIAAVMALPAWAEWRAAALQEPWVLPHDEVDWPTVLREKAS